NDIGRNPDGDPAFAAAIATFNQHTGDRARAAVEDTHLEVDQFEILDAGRIDAQIFSQGEVEGVDRAVALGDRHQQLALNAEFYDRLGDGDLLALGVVAALDHGTVVLDVEEIRQRAEDAAGQTGKGRIGAIIGIAAGFALFHSGEELFEARIVFF